jgi:hypothetical protein
MKPFGGCFKLGVEMKQLRNSIVVQSVIILGENTHSNLRESSKTNLSFIHQVIDFLSK